MGIKAIFSSAASFRSRLLWIVSCGILGLALTASVTTAWVTSNRAATQMVAQGLKVVDTLAQQSLLALLYESPTNAEKPLEAIISFPDVHHAGIVNNDFEILLQKGVDGLALPKVPKAHLLEEPKLVQETAANWYFIAPVSTGNVAGDDPADLFYQLDA